MVKYTVKKEIKNPRLNTKGQEEKIKDLVLYSPVAKCSCWGLAPNALPRPAPLPSSGRQYLDAIVNTGRRAGALFDDISLPFRDCASGQLDAGAKRASHLIAPFPLFLTLENQVSFQAEPHRIGQ